MTHGWQVQYRKPWKFFSDTRSLTHTPASALEDAIQYLASLWNGPPSRLRAAENATKKGGTGVAGVRIVIEEKRNRNAKQIYVEAYSPWHGQSSRRFYVGTENTVSDDRLMAALEKAILHRDKWVRQYEAERAKALPPSRKGDIAQRSST